MVSTQPPWSTATSTITAPGFMSFKSSRRINRGALAPGRRTAPITRSARRIEPKLVLRGVSRPHRGPVGLDGRRELHHYLGLGQGRPRPVEGRGAGAGEIDVVEAAALPGTPL